MIVNRKTSIRWNRPRKPIHLLTDRAKRYRANTEGLKPPAPRWCMFCGSRKAEVHHINGSENTCTRDNLGWSCRRCNVAVGNRLRKAGIGRLTRQFNPARRQGTRKAVMDEYAAAIKVMRGQFDGDVASRRGDDPRDAAGYSIRLHAAHLVNAKGHLRAFWPSIRTTVLRWEGGGPRLYTRWRPRARGG